MDIRKLYDINFKLRKNNKFFFINDRYRYEKTLRSLIFSKILNEYCNLNPIVLTDKTKYDKNHIYSKSNIKILSLRNKLSGSKINIYVKLFVCVIYFYINILLRKKNLKWLINDFKVNKIHIGDLLYDYYIRYDNNYINPNLYSIKFFKVLVDGIYKIKFIDECFKKYNPRLIISTSKGYTSIGNLLTRYGVKNKIKTISTGYNYIHLYKSYNNLFESIWKITKKKINELDKKTNQKIINNFIKKRLVGKVYGNYVAPKTIDKAFSKIVDDRFISKIKKEKKKRKIIVFALHCFSDAPHTSGKLVFNDYYHQFTSTIDFISKNKFSNYFWIIKPHPARNNYNEQGVIENYLKKYSFDNVIICTKKIKNNVLLKYTDYLVTTNSTIGLEFACFGKKAILGGDAPYYYKDLFFKPKNKYDYFKYLQNLNNISFCLTKKQSLLANKLLYLLEYATNINLPESKFLPNPITNPEIDNEKNYVNKIKEYCKKNLKELNNKSFKKENFYKKLKQELMKIVNGNRNTYK